MRYFSYSLVVHIVILAILAGAYIFMPTFTKPKDVVVTIVPYQAKQEIAKEETPKKETIKPQEQPQEQQKEQPKELPAPNETTTPKKRLSHKIFPKVIASKMPDKINTYNLPTATSPIKESKKKLNKNKNKSQVVTVKPKNKKAVAEYRAYVQQKIESAKEYPKMAQKLGQIGTVRVAIVISKDGSVSSASIVSSSGFSTLDTPTKRLIENMRFKPLPVEIEDGFLNLSSIPVNYRDDD